MKDILKELQDLQIEVDDFIEDIDTIQSKFASRFASSLDEYHNQDRLLQKAKSILSKYESLKNELEVEAEGETDPFISDQLDSLIANIDVMKSKVSSFTKTLKAIGNGLVPKILEKQARVIRKEIKSYFEKPALVTFSNKHSGVRTYKEKTGDKKFYHTSIVIKGYDYRFQVIEPIDGDYSKMPNYANVWWKGRESNFVEKWAISNLKGKGFLNEKLDPFAPIEMNAILELKTEMAGRGQLTNNRGPDKIYHFKPGTVLQYHHFRSRGDFYLKVIKLNAGHNNEYSVGQSINASIFFGTKERIDGDIKGAIGHDWGRMYTLKKHIKVKDKGFGGNNFDPGL